MEATVRKPIRTYIELKPEVHDYVASVAQSQHTSVKRYIERAIEDMMENIEDAAIYKYLCETDPEGQEMVSEEEQAAFLKELGLQ